MKILDRYVLSLFIKNYLISLMVLIGLYILLDMVFQFDELVELQREAGGATTGGALGVMGKILSLYFYRCFPIFTQLSAMIPAVAAAFTLMRLSRFNELVAMLAAGVPLLRVALPVIVAAGVLNFVLLPINQEIIVPAIRHKLVQNFDDLRTEGGRDFMIRWLQFSPTEKLSAGRYYPASAGQPPWIDTFDITTNDENNQPVAHLSADRATWNEPERRWDLTNGRSVTGLADDAIRSVKENVPFFRGGVTPNEITLYRNTDFVEMLSSSQLNELLARGSSYRQIDLLWVKHSRYMQWVTNVVVLLLTIPCVLKREPGKLRLGAFQALMLTGSCLATVFICQHLAATPPADVSWARYWPILMAWMPIFQFLPVAVVLCRRLKT